MIRAENSHYFVHFDLEVEEGILPSLGINDKIIYIVTCKWLYEWFGKQKITSPHILMKELITLSSLDRNQIQSLIHVPVVAQHLIWAILLELTEAV